VLWILLAAAFVARLALLIARPPWHDELFTLWASRLTPSRLLEVLRQDSGPPLFYVLEKPFVSLAEIARSDALARILPFAALACLLAPAMRLARDRASIWFLALAAPSPLLLLYSAEARAYGLLALFDFVLFLLLFRGEPSAPRLVGVAALTAVALWTHYLAILFVAACALLLAARRRFSSLAAVSAGALIFLPWVPVLLSQPEEATSWMREPLGQSLLAFVSALGGAGRIPSPQGGPLPVLLETTGVVVGVLLLVVVARAGRADHEGQDAAAVTLLAMVLVLASSLARPIAFPGRSEMAVLPIWLWSVSKSAATKGPALWASCALLAVSLTSSVCLLAAAKPEPLPSRAVALLTRTAVSQDRVAASGAFYLPARLAADRGDLRAKVIAYPLEEALHPGWFRLRVPEPSDEIRLEESIRRTPPGGRFFLLLYPHEYGPGLRSFLASGGTVAELIRRPDGLLIVWLRR